MYQTKITKAEKEEKLARAVAARNFLENDPYVLYWKKFLQLPQHEQFRIRKAWDQYYIDVRETVSFAIFQEQKEAMRVGNIAKVKELAETARLMKERGDVPTLPKPTKIDPWEFERGQVQAYLNEIKLIKELTDYNFPANEEARSVWED
jgi:hypothetical protein